MCSGKAGSIVCPDLRIIRIHGAFFGVQNGRDCLGRLTRDDIPTCFAPYTISTVRDICQGQQSCDLYTEPSLYGRSSCPAAENKYLSVSYSCIGHSYVEKNLQLLNQRGRPGNVFNPYYIINNNNNNNNNNHHHHHHHHHHHIFHEALLATNLMKLNGNNRYICI